MALAIGPGCGSGSDPGDGGGAILTTCVSGDRALAHVRRIAAFGSRHAGSEGIRATRRYIVEALGELGLEPVRQELVAEAPDRSLGEVAMVNLLVDLPGESGRMVILGGHYDGKRVPGLELAGANDGGSSVGLLLEMARCLAARPRQDTVRIAFLDGEEALGEGGTGDGLYGSRHLVASLRESGELGGVAAAFVVDMIGDRRLRISRDLESTEWLWRLVVGEAEELGLARHFAGPPLSVIDDHTPFIEAGVPSVLLIDLHYGPGWDDNSYWHSEEDTVDKLSARSFEVVGSVLLEATGEIGSRPAP